MFFTKDKVSIFAKLHKEGFIKCLPKFFWLEKLHPEICKIFAILWMFLILKLESLTLENQFFEMISNNDNFQDSQIISKWNFKQKAYTFL